MLVPPGEVTHAVCASLPMMGPAIATSYQPSSVRSRPPSTRPPSPTASVKSLWLAACQPSPVLS